VEALGYWVSVRRFRGRSEIINHGFTSQRIGTHLLIIYPPPFDPQRNEEEIARERNQQVNIESVEVEITQDLCFIDGSAPYPIFEDTSSEFYGLTAIQYQGEIIYWLQREYREHVQVGYTLYEEYLEANNQGQHSYPTHRASLSDLLLLNRVIKRIVHADAWYLPENPEFAYECIIRIQGSRVGVQIEEESYEFRGRRGIL
jgi:hypothetical protein